MPGSNTAGLLLALLTALFWGALPLALKHLLSTVDAISIVCLRFWIAAAWTWGLSCRHPGNSTPLGRREKWLLLLAIAGLGCNFVFFNSSVAYLSASACQILAQAGPVLLLLGSVFLLREPFLPIQGGSVIILLVGLLLFFNTRLLELASGDLLIGMSLGIMAAVVWACYGLAQKILLRTVSPGRIMRAIYLCCAIILTPLSSPASFLQLDALQTGCLVFTCINTIVAYGAFSRAMNNWHAAKVSAVVTTTPLFTLGLEWAGHLLLPHVFPLERLGLLSICGAFTVVTGAMGIALGPMLHLPHGRKDRQHGGS